MYVTLNRADKDLNIRVRWQYGTEKKKKKSKETICFIEEVLGEKSYEIIAFGKTRTRGDDVFTKRRGRVESMINLFAANKSIFSKSERTKIWNTYGEMVHYKYK